MKVENKVGLKVIVPTNMVKLKNITGNLKVLWLRLKNKNKTDLKRLN